MNKNIFYQNHFIMAKFTSIIANRMSGVIQDKLIRTLPSGDMIMTQKAALPTFKDKDVEEARDLRIKGMGGTSHIAPVVNTALRIGFTGLKRGQTTLGQFMVENANSLCDAERDEEGKLRRIYDFRAMIVSRGNLNPAKVTIEVAPETGKVTFLQEAQTIADAKQHPDDQVYGMVLEEVQEEAHLVALKPRGENGSTVFELPDTWDKTKIYVYTFVSYHNGKKSSRSVCHYPADSTRDASVRVMTVEDDILDAANNIIGRKIQTSIIKTLQRRKNAGISPEDPVYAILLNTEKNTANLLYLGQRKKSNVFNITPRAAGDTRATYVYTFAVQQDTGRSSVPLCHNAPATPWSPGVTATRDTRGITFTLPPATTGTGKENDTGTDTRAAGNAGTDAPSGKLYAAIFDSRERKMEVIPLEPGESEATVTYTPDEKSADRFWFLYLIAVTNDGKTSVRVIGTPG